MYILGVNAGLNASAALMRDNRVVFAIQEERICRVKNQAGFPSLSIKACLDHAGISVKDIDAVAVAGLSSNIAQDREQDLNKFHNRYNMIKDSWFGERRMPFSDIVERGIGKVSRLLKGELPVKERRIEDYLSELGLLEKAIRFDHHDCHAASAYYGLSSGKGGNEKALVFSMDGGGDGKTSTVYVGQDGRLEQIAASDSFSPACIYAHITYIMGFMPHEHEYKLMGLAPYAQPKYAATARDMLLKFVSLDKDNPLVLTNGDASVSNSKGSGKQELVEELFKSTLNMRFDTLSAGLQLMAEEIALRWVSAGIERTSIKRVLLSGGFFMNVKANKLISELPGLEYVNCFPSCGDESNIFGACYLAYQKIRKPGSKDIEFDSYCLGTGASFDIEEAMQKYSSQVNFRKSSDINSELVGMLVERQIVARCSGMMEFGARALGNRSILASPDDPRIINKINAAIKKRDFWMPFAPAMLQERLEDAVCVPDTLKSAYSPYMMFTFDAKPDMYDSLIAGIHQADKTARSQTVSKEIYPQFHDLISRFHAKTGIPAVLNTSFNLHGYPIVQGACDAVDVFLNSALDTLVVDDYIITRK